MSHPELPDNAPGIAIFPQFEVQLYQMFTSEVEGLTDPQLDYTSDRWEWSKWSVRMNLSHVAAGDFRWLLLRWGPQLFPEGPPDIEGLESIFASPYDRRLDDGKYWQLQAILGKLREGLGLCHSVLARETVSSLRTRELKTENSSQWELYGQVHPRGVRQDPADSSQVFLSLEATFRHRYFEHTTHLYNIQRLKRAQGLSTVVEIPYVGYWALPGWDRSEP